MKVAINDIAFMKGFKMPYDAQKALVKFANAAMRLRDERVSRVDAAVDIVNSNKVNKATELAPQYTLIHALNDIKSAYREQYLWILQMLTMVGEGTGDDSEKFCLMGFQSGHCARYKEDFLLSLISDPIFTKKTVQGILSEKGECSIRNIADESHIEYYWEELGFRLYEINPKHGRREYIRAGGEKVGIAPENDELGQLLLNHAIEYKGRLLSVDTERDNRIFEFRHSYANKFHGYLQQNLSEKDRQKLIEAGKRS
ncbi:MAG: hypothetical protein K2N39_09915 [Lachnospiraceae bacterium]|nr:hypothetical protein [Lachnospiraceae bacterium]